VQLFPFDFWSETTIVLGAVIVVIAGIIAIGAGRLAKRANAASAVSSGSAPSEAPVGARPEAAR
jgi:hypothetical protein